MVSDDGRDHGEERRKSEKGRDKERKKKSKRSSRDQSRDRKRSRERKRSRDNGGERNRSRDRSGERDHSRDRSGERNRSRDRSGERNRSRDRSGERNRSRDRSGERDHSRDRNGDRDRSRDRNGEQPPKRHRTQMSPSDKQGSSSSQAENMRRGLLQLQSSKSPGNPSESDFESPIKQLQVIGSKTKKQKLRPYEALARAKVELQNGNIRQAGEKGWLAVDLALKEVAPYVQYPMELESHRGKSTFASYLEDKFNKPEIHQLFCVAAAMYSNSYNDNMSEEAVKEDLKGIKELLSILDTIKRRNHP